MLSILFGCISLGEWEYVTDTTYRENVGEKVQNTLSARSHELLREPLDEIQGRARASLT